MDLIITLTTVVALAAKALVYTGKNDIYSYLSFISYSNSTGFICLLITLLFGTWVSRRWMNVKTLQHELHQVLLQSYVSWQCFLHFSTISLWKCFFFLWLSDRAMLDTLWHIERDSEREIRPNK